MSTKVISSYYAGGYFIQKGNDLLVTNTGTVGSPGVGAIYNATITNDGTISGGPTIGAIGMYDGGLITNGSPTDTGALISGLYGLVMRYVAGSVTNYGVIEGVHTADGFGNGVDLDAGGVVRNGAPGSRSAVIEGKSGVSVSGGAGAVYNFALIKGDYGNGVGLYAGGSVHNGANSDTSATIQDTQGVSITNAAGVVDNYGTIVASGLGVLLTSGGGVTNGSDTDHAALIQGGSGVQIEGANAVVVNAGTIRATGYGALGDGLAVGIGAGATLTNGALDSRGALIEGYYGVSVGSDATVTNFGTIAGTGGEAVRFAGADDVLNVEAHSRFIGAVTGAGGELNLASGTGTISGLFAAGGDVTVSGSMARTTFQDFGWVNVSAGATFTDSGKVTIGADQLVSDAGVLNLTSTGKDTNAGSIQTTGAGVLTIAGPLVNTGLIAADGGTLTVDGAVTGANGLGRIDDGTLDLASSFNQPVDFTGTTGVLELARSTNYTASIEGFATNGMTSLDLRDIGFVASTEATFAGTTQSGVMTVTDGTHTAHINLKGDYTASTFVASSDGHGGTVVVDPTAREGASAPSSAKFTEAMAGLGASGVVGAIHTAQTWLSGGPALATPHAATG